MYLVLLILLLFVPSLANATCTGQSFSFNVPTDPQSQAFTIPSVTNGITAVGVHYRTGGRVLNSITIGGNAMTAIGSKVTSTDTGTEVFYRLNATSGSQTVTVDFDSAPLSLVLIAVTCDGVSQATPIAVTNQTIGNGFPITLNCDDTPSGSVVLDFVSNDGNTGGLTPGPGQSGLAAGVADNLSSASSSEPGGGTVTMSQTGTGNDWGALCVALASDSVGSARTGGLLLQW